MADGMAESRGAPAFAALDEEAQDEILGAMAADETSPWGALYAATMMGMFAKSTAGTRTRSGGG
jgi:hypothetical protein